LQASPERRGVLERIGFVRNPNEYNWNKKYDELKHFATMHNHCNVPAKNKNDKSLQIWVGEQRREF